MDRGGDGEQHRGRGRGKKQWGRGRGKQQERVFGANSIGEQVDQYHSNHRGHARKQKQSNAFAKTKPSRKPNEEVDELTKRLSSLELSKNQIEEIDLSGVLERLDLPSSLQKVPTTQEEWYNFACLCWTYMMFQTNEHIYQNYDKLLVKDKKNAKIDLNSPKLKGLIPEASEYEDVIKKADLAESFTVHGTFVLWKQYYIITGDPNVSSCVTRYNAFINLDLFFRFGRWRFLGMN